MLKVDRDRKSLSQLATSTLAEAQMLERDHLQECIYNSGSAFFDEIGERVFLVGKEVMPSQTVQDRIDLLGIDSEGAAVIIELKRGSNKLQMFQAISYAGMISKWGVEDFRSRLSETRWEELTEFLDVDVEQINLRQRILLVAEGYDYALLVGTEWLSEQHNVDVRCVSVAFARDEATGAEYLACTSTYPPAELADHAVARRQSPASANPKKWETWEEALAAIENADVRAFAQSEMAQGRGGNLGKRALYFGTNGRWPWNFDCRNKHAYVWQDRRFEGDIEFWRARVSVPERVRSVNKGTALSFILCSGEDIAAFKSVTDSGIADSLWLNGDADASGPAEPMGD